MAVLLAVALFVIKDVELFVTLLISFFISTLVPDTISFYGDDYYRRLFMRYSSRSLRVSS